MPRYQLLRYYPDSLAHEFFICLKLDSTYFYIKLVSISRFLVRNRQFKIDWFKICSKVALIYLWSDLGFPYICISPIVEEGRRFHFFYLKMAQQLFSLSYCHILSDFAQYAQIYPTIFNVSLLRIEVLMGQYSSSNPFLLILNFMFSKNIKIGQQHVLLNFTFLPNSKKIYIGR